MSNILLEIPLKPIPNQQTTCALLNQQVSVDVYLQDTSLFCNVYLAGTLIVAGMRATHGSYVNQFPTALVGYLFWWDDNGRDPDFRTLGTIGHLYFANYDVLEILYAKWVQENLTELNEEFP